MSAPRVNPGIARMAIVCLASGFLAGCTASKGGSEVGHYSVRVPQTAMYRYGPAQNFGADFNLTQGQHVVMLGKDYGYSRVMTDDGQSGYVATEDLVPAAPPAVEKPKRGTFGGLFVNTPPLPSRGTSKRGVSSANNQILQGSPLFGSGDGDLAPLPPLPDGDPLPNTEGNKPGFRVNVRPPTTGNAPTGTKEGKVEGKPEGKTEGKAKPGFRVNVPTPDR
jgi:hypothetical protein